MTNVNVIGESSKERVRLRSSDEVLFDLPWDAALMSNTIKLVIDEDGATSIIPTPNIEGKILAKLIQYMNKHTESNMSEEDIKKFDAEFVEVDLDTMFHLLMGTNYLEIKDLLDLLVQAVADMIKGKDPEEIRQLFGIENDFSPEEEAVVRAENQWAYES